jgi:hypothetical protein
MLIVAMANAPLVGMVPDDLLTAHRVEMDGLPAAEWETASESTAVCGAGVKLLHLRWEDLRTRNTPVKRCRQCNPRVKAVAA